MQQKDIDKQQENKTNMQTSEDYVVSPSPSLKTLMEVVTEQTFVPER